LPAPITPRTAPSVGANPCLGGLEQSQGGDCNEGSGCGQSSMEHSGSHNAKAGFSGGRGGFGFIPSGGTAQPCACGAGFGWLKNGNHPCGGDDGKSARGAAGRPRVSGKDCSQCAQSGVLAGGLGSGMGRPWWHSGGGRNEEYLSSSSAVSDCREGDYCCCVKRMCFESDPGDGPRLDLRFKFTGKSTLEETKQKEDYQWCALHVSESGNLDLGDSVPGMYDPERFNRYGWNVAINDNAETIFSDGSLMGFQMVMRHLGSVGRKEMTTEGELFSDSPFSSKSTNSRGHDAEVVQWVRWVDGCRGRQKAFDSCKPACCALVRWNYQSGRMWVAGPVCSEKCNSKLAPLLITSLWRSGPLKLVNVDLTMHANAVFLGVGIEEVRTGRSQNAGLKKRLCSDGS
jgi:hypothetical protein